MERDLLKVAVASCNENAIQVIKQLLLPWTVTISGIDDADVLVAYGESPHVNMKTVIIPSNYIAFWEWLKNRGLNLTKKSGKSMHVQATNETVLTLTPRYCYCHESVTEDLLSTSDSLPIRVDDETLVLRVDIIEEYNKIAGRLNPNGALLYRVLTGLPISYTIVPKRLRKYSIGVKPVHTIMDFCDLLPMDALRYVLLCAIEKITNRTVEKKSWDCKGYAFCLTHDVETREGLYKAKIMKKCEAKYDVPSTWYIPSKQFELAPEIVRELANFGEVGAHDSKHDGKLADLPQYKITDRLRDAKTSLEKVTGCAINGFRAPLLQLNLKILKALEETGYTYDTSAPTWEPKNPYVMKSHGVGTVNILKIGKVLEVPVTLPQDDQMFHVLGFSPKRTVREWGKMRERIRDIGGLCTLLVHPDYELSRLENLGIYEELVSEIAADNHAWITTPGEIVNDY